MHNNPPSPSPPPLPSWLSKVNGGWRLSLHIQPSAKRNAIVGAYGDRLKIALASPALEGAANFALRRFLADRLKLPMSALHILRGETTRQKILAIATDLPIAELLIPPLN